METFTAIGMMQDTKHHGAVEPIKHEREKREFCSLRINFGGVVEGKIWYALIKSKDEESARKFLGKEVSCVFEIDEKNNFLNETEAVAKTFELAYP